MPTDTTLLADAQEMHRIIQGASCMRRHSVISLDKLAEILTALATGGTVAERNAKGYDVASPEYGKIEVKARVLGTDGTFPRITLTPNKLVGANSFMAVRWDGDHRIHAAVMLDRDTVRPLYEARLQASGKYAHIAWGAWKNAPGAIDFTARFAALIAGNV